tara:strand:- start:318 stop:617 length:300 start_codon:yes stop_codon:yes gene_type:complete
LIYKARYGNDIDSLASPLTNCAVLLYRFQQLFIGALKQGVKTPELIAQWVWKITKSQEHRLVIEDQPLETEDANIVELAKQAIELFEKQLPLIKKLQVV